MNIDINKNLKTSTVNASSTSSAKISKEDEGKFAKELKTLSDKETKDVENDKEIKKTKETTETKETKDEENVTATKDVSETKDKSETKDTSEVLTDKNNKTLEFNNKPPEEIINGLKNVVNEIQKINRTDEKVDNSLKEDTLLTDNENNNNFFIKKTKLSFEEKFQENKNEENKEQDLIDSNLNVQEPKDKTLPQMEANMNFNSDGQPFAEFVNPKNEDVKLKVSASELEEEKKILSTMDENIAMANKIMIQQKPLTQKPVEQKTEIKINNVLQEISEDNIEIIEPKTKTVTTEEGVKKVDKKTNVTVETVIKYDTVIMDKSDVEFFSKLVNEGVVDVKEVQNAEKSSQVSKTLADLIAKSMNDNKPVRIDFDNDISIIIKISKNGKISADFLPSSQIAEAYLKENLPMLKQRFDDNNIDYEELNQRQRQQRDSQENRKKGRKDE